VVHGRVAGPVVVLEKAAAGLLAEKGWWTKPAQGKSVKYAADEDWSRFNKAVLEIDDLLMGSKASEQEHFPVLVMLFLANYAHEDSVSREDWIALAAETYDGLRRMRLRDN